MLVLTLVLRSRHREISHLHRLPFQAHSVGQYSWVYDLRNREILQRLQLLEWYRSDGE